MNVKETGLLFTPVNVKETGLLFTPENREKAIAGTKTQTRRVVKGDISLSGKSCPYGKPGDRLYLQEPTQVLGISKSMDNHIAIVRYRDGAKIGCAITNKDREKLLARNDFATKETTSRFMLKSFARHWFRVESVKVERLQEISEKDAIAEGAERTEHGWKCYGNCPDHDRGYTSRSSATASFKSLWNSINGKTNPWDSNPFVWVIEFSKDAIEG